MTRGSAHTTYSQHFDIYVRDGHKCDVPTDPSKSIGITAQKYEHSPTFFHAATNTIKELISKHYNL